MSIISFISNLGLRGSLKQALELEESRRDINVRYVSVQASQISSGDFEIKYLCPAEPWRTGFGTDLAVIFREKSFRSEDGARGRAAEQVANCLPRFESTVYSFVGISHARPYLFDKLSLTWQAVASSQWRCESCGVTVNKNASWTLDMMVSGHVPYCEPCERGMVKA